MKSYITNVLSAICVISISLLAGCTNTINGAGEDMRNLGNELNPPPHKVHHKTTETTTTTSQLSTKLDAANAPIQKNSDTIPEESY